MLKIECLRLEQREGQLSSVDPEEPASVIADVALSISASIRAARDGALLGRIPAGFFESDSKVDSFGEKEGGG